MKENYSHRNSKMNFTMEEVVYLQGLAKNNNDEILKNIISKIQQRIIRQDTIREQARVRKAKKMAELKKLKKN